MITTDIKVRYANQAYGCRVGKVSASSTSSAEAAARRMAEKLFGDLVERVEEVPGESDRYTSWWRITLAGEQQG